MKNLLIILITIIPVFAEIGYDKGRWKRGLDDKPSSTWIRSLVFILLAIPLGFLFDGDTLFGMLLGGILLWATHVLLFNYLLNISRPGIKLSYRKESEFWTKFTPWYGELFAKFWLYYVAWAMYFHWNWVQGEYPNTLIDYFKF